MKLKKNLIYLNNKNSRKIINKDFSTLKQGDRINIKYLNLDTTKKGAKLSRLNSITGLFLTKFYNKKTRSFQLKISVLYKTEKVIWLCLINSPYIIEINILK